MLSATDSHGKEVYFWKTMPRSRPGPVTGVPFTSTSPLSGWSRPAMMRRTVDFPQPGGPSRTRNSPTSRPSAAKAFSTSKLTSSSARIVSPCGLRKLRLTLRRAILILFSMRLGRHGDSRSHGRASRVGGPGGFAPREQAVLDERQQAAEQERSDPDGDNTGENALEIHYLPRRLQHIADAFARIDHLGQDHVGPADIVQNPERAKDRRERSAEHQP